MNGMTRCVLASAMIWSGALQAANGDIDTSFGTNGFAFAGLTDAFPGHSACKPVLQTDGKIVFCAARTANGSSGTDMIVLRHNADGTPDNSFSFDGITEIDFGNPTDVAAGLAVQNDGKIVVAGTTQGTASHSADFAAARLNADGSLDTSFGGGTGKVTVGFDLDAGSGDDIAGAMALQADGKIIIVGSAETATGTLVAVTRLLPDGTRDSQFNLNGKVTFAFGASSSEQNTVLRVSVDMQGRIVLTSTTSTDGAAQFGVARLLANGSLDPNFHANGRTLFDFGGNASFNTAPYALILQRDGRIVVGGAANSSTSSTENIDTAIARLLPDGSLDTSFGFGGRTMVAFDLGGQNLDAILDGVQQANGSLMFVGTATTATGQIALALRLRADGTLDNAFGAFGKMSYDFAFTSPDVQAFGGVVLQGTHFVVAGLAYVPPGGSSPPIDIFLTRIADDTIFANGFE